MPRNGEIEYPSVPYPLLSPPNSYSIVLVCGFCSRLQSQASLIQGLEQHRSLGKSSEKLKIQFNFLVVPSVDILQIQLVPLPQRGHSVLCNTSAPVRTKFHQRFHSHILTQSLNVKMGQ